MSGNFHESFARQEVAPPSERATGLVFAAVAAIVAVLWRDSPAVLGAASAAAVILAAISLLVPSILKPLNIVWFQIGLFLHRIVNPLVMFLIFAIVFVPAGLIMRIWYDPLRSKRTKDASTYWIERSRDGEAAGSMTNQF